jgi:hypothetical protein
MKDVKFETVRKRELEETPSFYSSMASLTGYSRFAGSLAVETNSPKVTEYITRNFAVVPGEFTVEFQERYKKTPLLQGVFYNTENDSLYTIKPGFSTQILAVDKKRVILQSQVTGIIKLRVYNIDHES